MPSNNSVQAYAVEEVTWLVKCLDQEFELSDDEYQVLRLGAEAGKKMVLFDNLAINIAHIAYAKKQVKRNLVPDWSTTQNPLLTSSPATPSLPEAEQSIRPRQSEHKTEASLEERRRQLLNQAQSLKEEESAHDKIKA